MNAHSDVVIIGAGSGGYACAFRAAQLGLTVTLIEQDAVGGTCLHRGCIPTKALLHAAEIADSAREGAELGIDVELRGINLELTNKYKSAVVAKLYKGLQGLIKAHRINLVTGRGDLIDATTVRVGEDTYTGRAIVLATGSYPKTLPGLQFGDRVWSSDQALRVDHVPKRVIILGGGVIGVEFASLWRSFGSKVTIIEALPHLVPAEDEWTSNQLERAFRRRGITIRTKARFTGVECDEDAVRVALDSGEVLGADALLVAVGRGPRTDTANLEQAGITLDRGFVVVDENLRTSLDGVYAVGDIVSGVQLAHRGFQQGIFVAERIAGMSSARPTESGIPRVTYSSPEVASVGLTEQQARNIYGEVETATYDLAGNGKSQILRSPGGVKLIQAGDGTSSPAVVGIHMVGPRVGELVGEAQLIYNWNATAVDVAPYIHAHPSLGEAIGEAHLALAGRPLHSHS
ncbi:MAG: dihydrolipoyl dehydrogenase [Comamonadaceae bacterium]|nr:MAG: dihydrolipoyl dehydrogenase [Comamonadaceae bacterium]